MKTLSFKEKVQSMTAKEIIMAMVTGLKENPFNIKINMWSFGWKNANDDIQGCAAMVTICGIAGKMFDFEKSGKRKFSSIEEDENFIDNFESAIDCLRHGFLPQYNEFAEELKIPLIENPDDIYLPPLTNTNNYLDHLEPYIQLANTNK